MKTMWPGSPAMSCADSWSRSRSLENHAQQREDDMEYRDTDADPIQTDVSKGGLSRRQALKSLGAAGIAAATMPFLGGAARADMSGQLIGPGGIPLARPAHPVKLPVFEDPINSGLQPETGGTF